MQERAQSARKVVDRAVWLQARRALLEEEKALTRRRDAVSAMRRDLPVVRLDKDYRFDGPEGPLSLDDLFAGRSQLMIYHFMFAPEDEWGCKSCSFWADHFDALIPHLAARDVTFAAVSRAPLDKLRRQATRLGWRFPWVSSGETDFNYDYGVSFREAGCCGATEEHNYAPIAGSGYEGERDLPGVSVFVRDPKGGAPFHAYSTYGRGIEAINATYGALDLTPAGRSEQGLGHTMSWVRLHDDYAG